MVRGSAIHRLGDFHLQDMSRLEIVIFIQAYLVRPQRMLSVDGVPVRKDSASRYAFF
jgi:hypothetical protein